MLGRNDVAAEHRLIGIGVGPANLSLAALLDTSRGRADDVFFESKPHFQWHPGMMMPNTVMQVHFLKDLVTPVDPTNPHSFLAYTVGRGEFYRLLNTRRNRLSRREFEAYCSWVTDHLPSVRCATEVLEVRRATGGFEVTTSKGIFRSRHLSIGTGVSPNLPPFVRGITSAKVTHSTDFLHHPVPETARQVVVIGGGQSGAEVVTHLQDVLPPDARIHWVTRRSNFLPLDESPFVEDYFTPEASENFFQQSASARTRLLEEQRLASDGISDGLLEQIYQRMYDVRNGYREGPETVTRVATELVDLTVEENGPLRFSWFDRRSSELTETDGDFAILATGYEQRMPEAIGPLLPELAVDEGRPRLRPDFSLVWDGPETSRIFLQNGARHVRGVADPNLSLLAWRSATIAQAIAPDLTERLISPALAGAEAGASERRGDDPEGWT